LPKLVNTDGQLITPATKTMSALSNGTRSQHHAMNAKLPARTGSLGNLATLAFGNNLLHLSEADVRIVTWKLSHRVLILLATSAAAFWVGSIPSRTTRIRLSLVFLACDFIMRTIDVAHISQLPWRTRDGSRTNESDLGFCEMTWFSSSSQFGVHSGRLLRRHQ